VPPHAAKTRLRRALRARRAALAAQPRAEASAALAAHLRASPTWQAAASIAAFVGVRGEPDTLPLLEAALHEQRQLWLPRVLHGPGGLSELVHTPSLDHLAPAGFGLLEPAPRPDERTLSPVEAASALDLILVPGLAFTSSGVRLGFGAGHYDRLLAPVEPLTRPIRVGICFHAFLDPPEGPLPSQPHDVSMHWIATERGLHRCGGSTD